MQQMNKILIVDDEPEMRSFLVTLLGSHFEIDIAADGEEAIDKIFQSKYMFIILDFDLPKLTGLEVCEKIAELEESIRPAVVMVSGNSGDNIICKAYDLGVDDYIVKPFCSTAFYQRMQRLERDIKDRHRLVDESSKTHSLVTTAMEQASQYGSAFELISRLNKTWRLEDLAKEVTTYFRQQGYFTAIQLRSPEGTVSLDVDTGACSEVELKIFNVLHDKGRIYGFGQRSIFNDESTSLLVKNMPEKTTNSYGFLVDIAAKLLPAMDNRVKAIINEQVISEAASTLSDAIEAVRGGLKNIELEKNDFMENVLSQISLSFHHLELTEQQESFFADLIEKQLEKQNSSEQLVKVDFLINQCLQKIERTQAVSAHEQPEEESSSAQAVEFF